MQYPIAIYKNNQVFHVVFPDIPDLTTQGRDVADAIYNARHTVSDYLYELVQKDSQLPEPSPISEHLNKLEFAGYIWAVVSIELSRLLGETAEITIRLPAQLVSELYRNHPQQDINQIILNALKKYLETTPQ